MDLMSNRVLLSGVGLLPGSGTRSILSLFVRYLVRYFDLLQRKLCKCEIECHYCFQPLCDSLSCVQLMSLHVAFNCSRVSSCLTEELFCCLLLSCCWSFFEEVVLSSLVGWANRMPTGDYF